MIITDGWRGYSGLSKKGYGHQELRSYDGIGDGHATELPSCRKFAQALDHGNASRGHFVPSICKTTLMSLLSVLTGESQNQGESCFTDWLNRRCKLRLFRIQK